MDLSSVEWVLGVAGSAVTAIGGVEFLRRRMNQLLNKKEVEYLDNFLSISTTVIAAREIIKDTEAHQILLLRAENSKIPLQSSVIAKFGEGTFFHVGYNKRLIDPVYKKYLNSLKDEPTLDFIQIVSEELEECPLKDQYLTHAISRTFIVFVGFLPDGTWLYWSINVGEGEVGSVKVDTPHFREMLRVLCASSRVSFQTKLTNEF